MHLLRQYLHRVFYTDTRALSFMRIWVASVLLLDIGIRATDLEAHYSNMGVLPLHVLHANAWNQFFFSFHALSGLWQFQLVLFVIAGLSAICLLLGYHTRWATFISWILLLSVQNRNPLITQSGDSLLRMLLFWGMFLPWHRHYSVDARRSLTSETNPHYLSVASAAYLLQVAWVYVFTALLKSGPDWTTDGTALYYALSLDQILMPGGRILYQFPELMKFLTHATYFLELWLPFILLIPWRTTWFRMLFIGAIIGLHIGISLSLFVGLFYLISISAVIGLLPTPVMDTVDRYLRTGYKRVHKRWARAGKGLRSPLEIDVQLKWNSPRWASGFPLRYLREGVVLVALILALWWNLSTLGKPYFQIPAQMQWAALVPRLDQNWSMFAPNVFKDDGWYVLEGFTNNNRKVDLNQQGKEPDTVKPASVMSLFKNDRWRKYSENYLFVPNEYMRPYYCFYLMRRWNESHPKPEQINELNVIYMKEFTLPDYKTAPIKREVLCNCKP
ncbi:HTTM domain-containing protein [Rufibacter hautae]|uniref:HTTM domain-containing protein n=1 Tax=Rufibacter hautae TaxID=2595005 RepID=A0A5B6THS3_9BACT|nr:HTTM domain-containing protein [Rufibacter hautae]KAA3440224.1 HTTM domain-containing protein [Rufibacter hautae]